MKFARSYEYAANALTKIQKAGKTTATSLIGVSKEIIKSNGNIEDFISSIDGLEDAEINVIRATYGLVSEIESLPDACANGEVSAERLNQIFGDQFEETITTA